MKRNCIALLVMLTVWSVSVCGADWPQFLGPDRNAVSPETGLARSWPESGPQVNWTFPLGSGYGAPAVFNGKVYVLDRVDSSQDVLRCLDLGTGKEEWSFAYDAPGRVSHSGSRSVPSVDEQRIYTCGPHGDVYCIDKTTHKSLWNKNFKTDFGEGARLGWGFGQNPLLYKDMLIVAPMASEAGVVALDKVTGEIRWKTPPMPGGASYVSPTIISVDGVEQVVMISAAERSRRRGRDRDSAPSSGDNPAPGANKGSIIGYDPATGRQLWIYNGGWQCQIPIPNLVSIGDGRFFITGGYEAGSAMIKITKTDQTYAVEELYTTQNFGAHIHPPLLIKDNLYGHCTTNSRRDGMVCMNVDGKLQWKTERSPVFDKGGFILADGLIFSVDGRDGFLYLIDPSPEGFKPLAKAKLLEPGEVWSPLALVDGKLLIRDQTQMKCVTVR